MDWLNGLIHDTEWRQMIYKLFDKYPHCEFLNFAIMVLKNEFYCLLLNVFRL